MKVRAPLAMLLMGSLVCVLLVTRGVAPSPPQTTAVDEAFVVYFDGADYRVRGQISGADSGSKASYRSAVEAIQNAIDRTRHRGGAVVLEPGRYELEQPIRLRDNVTLRGSGRSTELRIKKNNPTGTAVAMEHLNGATVADLAITGGGRKSSNVGVLLDDCGDCVVSGILVLQCSQYGISLEKNSFMCELRNCRLADNGLAGVRCFNLRSHGRGGDYVPNTISNCIAYGGGAGFECDCAIVVNLLNCTVYQSRRPAYYLHKTSNSVLISGCRSFQIETDAVVVDGSHEINISSSILCWHRGNGIVLRNAAWGTVSANNVIDSGVRDKLRHDGIVLTGKTRGVQVTGNAIFNWGDQLPMRHGIFEATECSQNLIANNNVNFCTAEGIASSGKNSLVVNNIEVTEKAHLGMGGNSTPDFNRDALKNFLASLQGLYSD